MYKIMEVQSNFAQWLCTGVFVASNVRLRKQERDEYDVEYNMTKVVSFDYIDENTLF